MDPFFNRIEIKLWSCNGFSFHLMGRWDILEDTQD